ncbi:hypothetical protein [Solirubrobacter soli]|uniref:hypothetical protein n=1 Tax=Solirubrobacter soli TaxID=363832 RepID=UPI00040E83C1|nr:hypothetical protein [Solirubrobacter soli]
MLRAGPQERRERRGRGGVRDVAAEHPLLALQRSAGNAAVARAVLARRFDRAAYDKAMAEREKFLAWVYESHSWRPSTHRGNFDVLYEPKSAALTVTVKCKFWFKDGDPADWEDEEDVEPGENRWDPAAILKWKADFMRQVSAKWSGNFTFYCGRPWWEDLQAAVQVRFVESEEKESHYALTVTKVPDTAYRQSRVKGPKRRKAHGHGNVKLNSGSLTSTEKTGDQYQTAAFHEAGHMLGLGDEYTGDEDRLKKPVAHEELVKAEFGHGVPRKDDGSIMSTGDDIKPWHGVTFLEALRGITGVQEWSHTQHAPTPGPPQFDMSPPVDGPMPHQQNPLAPAPPEVAFT